MDTQITAYSSQFFQVIRQQAKEIEAEVHQIDRMKEKREKLFDDCMNQYKRYISQENEVMDRNIKHSESQNEWFRDEVSKSWKIAVNNRAMVLRSVGRTNVLKKDVDEWLQRIDGPDERGDEESLERSRRESMEGSKLIDKYNNILMEYGHRM